MSGMAFKRMYVDIPPDTHDALKILAIEKGMSQKALVAMLINDACTSAKPKRKKSKRSKK